MAGDPGSLYRCTGGDRSLVRVCDAGCAPAEPGQDDACATSCPLGDGQYCGGNQIAGNEHSLYECTAGRISEIERCEAGCFEAPPGEPDSCNQSCPLGDGLYCGGVQVGGEKGSLYQCSGGQLALAEVCAEGCDSQPPGTPDRCR